MKDDVILWDFFLKNVRMMLLDEHVPRVESVVETCKKEGKYIYVFIRCANRQNKN